MSFPPEKGGAPTRIYNLALLLHKAGYEVTVLTSMPNYPLGSIFPGYRGRLICKENVDGIRVIRLWLIPSNSGRRLWRALSLVSQLVSLVLMAFPRLMLGRTKAVIISSPPLITAWATALMARIAGKMIIVNISDIWPLTAAEMGALKGGFLLRMLQRMERQLYKMAEAFTGQSREILDHIATTAPHEKPAFLYRNLQPLPVEASEAIAPVLAPAKQVIYAGNLGHAQGMLELCRQVDFAVTGITLHIFGDGAERAALQDFITAHPGRGLVLHDTMPQSALNEQLPGFDAVLIPLKMNIHGAVPSKLFMAVANGLPVLFCGGGEGEALVKEHGLGWVSAAGDYSALQENLGLLSRMEAADAVKLRSKVAAARSAIFNKEMQDEAFLTFIAAAV